MQVFLTHKIKYTADSIPLSEVIESLQAQQRLLQEGVAVLSRAAPDSDLRLVNVQVQNIATNSLLIDLLLELYHAYQDSIDKEVIKGIEAFTGVDVPPEAEALVTLATLGVTYFVARWAYDAVVKKKTKDDPGSHDLPPVHIQGNYNNVINVIAGQLRISPEAVDRAFIEELTPKKRRQLVSRVADFFRPAKNAPGSRIEVAGAEDIESETIAEIPADHYLRDLSDISTINLPNVRLEIRALDRDSLKSGWKAKILGNDLFPNKLPMDLYPTVNAENLADHRVVTADIAVEFARDRDDAIKPKRLHLLGFKPDGE